MHRIIYPIEDLEYIGFDKLRGDWVVNEQLYPEARGWLVHGFKTQADAERFAATGHLAGCGRSNKLGKRGLL